MTAIEFKNVSKKFKKGEKYNSLRDFIPGVVKKLFSRNGNNKLELQEREFWALKDVNFCLKKGETLGIIGPNGAGKSTILKILSKILTPTKGKVVINGMLSALIEIGAGFHPDLTGRENVYLSGIIMGMSRRDIEKKFDSIVEFSGLNDFIDTPVKRYSSGMYVRLGFSVAAHMDPEILLIDEVLSVGDIGFMARCIDRIRDLVARGVTIIFISHNIDAVLGLCKRTMVLDKGELKFLGDTHEAVMRYKEIVRKRKEEFEHIQIKKIKDDSEKAVDILEAVTLDKDGNAKDIFFTGEEMIVNIKFIAYKKIQRPVFGFGLGRSDGLYVYGQNTHLDKYHIDEISGKGTMEIRFKALNLLDGEYHISAAVFTDGALVPLFLKPSACFFNVHSTRNDQGAVFLEHSWRISNGNDK